ncbi:MAG TPA: lipid-binding SYLF domain-containing protein [Bryobacteraceae bacterium]|nr:lipid-binding SYLF domain-containing protein [Bryobacteraceae bacterium]
MKFVVTTLLAAALLGIPAFAQKSAEARLNAATEDLKDMMQASDKGIPQDLFDKAACVIVVPNLKAGGFIVGGQYGKGFFSCRKESGRGWSAPGSLKLTGGKFGLLIGGKETDVIMLVMNSEGMSKLLKSKFQIGGEASGAAGPVGRDSTAMTDAMMHAQILSYSRSRGVFGGLDLGGSAVMEDEDGNRELYGKTMTNKEILDSKLDVPMAARPFIHTLTSISSRK